jgi:hypothetical protein
MNKKNYENDEKEVEKEVDKEVEKESLFTVILKPFLTIAIVTIFALGVILLIPGTDNSTQELYNRATSTQALNYIAGVMSAEDTEDTFTNNIDNTNELVKSEDDYYVDKSVENSMQKDNTETSAISDEVNYKLSYFNNAIVNGKKVMNEYEYLDTKDYAIILVTKDMIKHRDDMSKCYLGRHKDYLTTLTDYSYDGVAYNLSGINTNALFENRTIRFEGNYFNVDTDFSYDKDEIQIFNSIYDEMTDDTEVTYIDEESNYFSYLIKNSANKVIGIVFIEDAIE